MRARKFAYIESMTKLGKKRREIEASRQYQIYENEIVDIIQEMSEVTTGPFPDHFPKKRFYDNTDDK
ncbi:hypothetical protein [Enterococcus sp. CWB-B31]|uniref:hypothetical protein n=1 Tax=Enterococcus sp. CWB-B31 TaxID=2885159 RepID=UPI001E44F49F|nr:hypothetical protein [Enterococcus sp. CWB-B31]MCB5953674.1 hypothetical protein [Enterococcus sp. CWB-B31]